MSVAMQFILIVYQKSTIALEITQEGHVLYCNCHSTCTEGIGQIALTLGGIIPSEAHFLK
jgi:hypothetical protein